MSGQVLGELAKDYAKGTIAKNSYRKSHAELIKGIIAGNIIVEEIDYEPPLRPTNEMEEAITEGIKRDKTQIVSPKQTPEPEEKPTPTVKQNTTAKKNNKKSPYIFMLVSAALVLSLIVAVFLFYPKPPDSEITEISSIADSTKSLSNAVVAANTSSAGESLIADFLSEKNWSEDSLDHFIASWSALTDLERNAAKQTKRMQRMNDSIYKQFREGKALASIDSEKSLMKQQKLIEFANAIGINDSRLVLD